MAGLILLGASATVGTAGPAEPPIVNDTCSVCHGHDGISPQTSFPNLAGQTKAYLEGELKDFHDRTRADHDAKAYMWSVAGGLSARSANSAVQYFSALKPPKAAAGDLGDIVAGQKIFEQGIPPDVPACQSCHGAKAVGNETFPRLADQHREYLMAQLRAFRSKERDDPIMSPIAEHLTDGQIRVITAYLASL